MASGELVGLIQNIMPPTTTPATPDVRVSASTPPELFPVWDFDPTGAEYLDFFGTLINYGAGGLTVQLRWAADGVATGDVVWGAGFRRIADDAEDIDVSHNYDFNYVTVTAPSVDGEVDYATITFTHGADMASLANGESFVMRILRNPADAADTMSSNDAQLLSVAILET